MNSEKLLKYYLPSVICTVVISGVELSGKHSIIIEYIFIIEE